MRIERSVDIDVPVDEVFAFVGEPLNDPRWCTRVKSVEQVEGDGPGVGARYAVVHQPVKFRKPAQLDHRVLEFEPPRRIRFREEDEDGVFNVVYQLEATARGTRITQRDDLELMLPRVLHPVARFNVRRHLSQQFQALKRLLEEGG